MRGFIREITGVRQQVPVGQCISSEDTIQVMKMKEGYAGIHLAVGVQLLAVVSRAGSIPQRR